MFNRFRCYSGVSTSHVTKKYCAEKITDKERTALLVVRVLTLFLLASLLFMHIRSLRVFRWEQSVSGGILVTYLIAGMGLALCAGIDRCGGSALQAYLCATGAAGLVANAAAIWRRWRFANELTHAMAELLFALGVPLQRQVIIKVCLSAAAAVCLLIDLAMVPIFAYMHREKDTNGAT